jgi:hypothetical protein
MTMISSQKSQISIKHPSKVASCQEIIIILMKISSTILAVSRKTSRIEVIKTLPKRTGLMTLCLFLLKVEIITIKALDNSSREAIHYNKLKETNFHLQIYTLLKILIRPILSKAAFRWVAIDLFLILLSTMKHKLNIWSLMEATSKPLRASFSILTTKYLRAISIRQT